MTFDPKAIVFAIRSNFWFIPSALALAAIVAAILVSNTDLALYGNQIPLVPYAGIPLESARLVLSTIAGSMITVASLVFSMTLVALTLVSQQLGPRILLRFMDDRPTQIVLGLFIATFLFSLIVLFRIDDNAVSGRVPGLGILSSAGLAVASLGMMIHFVHHIANRIQADVLIAALGKDLNTAAATLISSRDQSAEIATEDEIKAFEEQFEKSEPRTVRSARSGYLGGIDVITACRIGLEHDLIFKSRVRSGEFVLAGTPVIDVVGLDANEAADEIEEEIQDLLRLGQRRTPEASIEFELNALVEVALRALSPGVNDPYTAMACVDRLADGLRILMDQKSPHRIAHDAEDDIRFQHVPEPFERYLKVAFDPVIEMARNYTLVTNKLETALTGLHETSSSQGARVAIAETKKKL
jgi:uncharacterized membrane protein